MEKIAEVLQQQFAAQQQKFEELQQRNEEQMKLMRNLFQSQLSAGASSPSTSNTATIASATPTFQCFDSTTELWTDYLSRFATFAEAHSIQASKLPQVFLTNQSPTIYKLLSDLASQETPPKGVDELSMDQIKQYMKQQFDPKRFFESDFGFGVK